MLRIFSGLFVGMLFALILGCGKERANFAGGQNQKKPKILIGHTDDESKLPEGMALHKDRDPNAPARVNRMPVVIDDPAEIRRTQQVFEKRIAELYDDALARVAKGDWIFPEDMRALKVQREKALADLRQLVDDERLDPPVRTNAAEVLIALEDPAGETFLSDMLQSPSVDMRLAALQSLCRWKSKLDLSKSDWPVRVLSLLDDPDERVVEAAAKVFRFHAIPGAEARLIGVLEKNSLKNPTAIADELAEVATTKRAVNALLPYVLNENADGYREWTGWSGITFHKLMENPDPEVSDPVRKALYNYTLRFKEQRYDQTLVRELAQSAGPDGIPVLEDIMKNARDPLSRTYALEALVRLQPEKALDLLTDNIKREGIRGGIWLLREHVTENDFDRVVPMVVDAYQRSKKAMDRGTVELLWAKFGSRGRQFIKDNLNNLDKDARMWAFWKLENKDLVAAITELEMAGVIQSKPSELIQKMRDIQKANGVTSPLDTSDPDLLLGALLTAEIVVMFDIETNRSRLYHDRLILAFAHASNGRFAPQWPIQICHRAKEEDYDSHYTVQFVLKNRLFRTDAENSRKGYDVEAVVRLIHFALDTVGEPRRIIALATGDQTTSFVFADPVAFLPIAKKYGLPLSQDPTEAMRQGIDFEKRVMDRTK